MPLYCIHAIDRPDSAAIRTAQYPAHRAYLANAAGHGVAIRASGPLVTEDGAAAVGSLIIVEAATLDAARRFNAADPFALAGLWAAVSIERFDLKRGSFGP
jgi:uncharacterized protein